MKDIVLLQQQAEQGDLEALHDLGFAYYNGDGTEADRDKAFECWLKAAQQGFAPSQFNAAEVCEANENYFEAMHWFGKAARAGIKEAAKRMKGIRLFIVKCCETLPEPTSTQYTEEIEEYKQTLMKDIDLFIEDCKLHRTLRPKSYTRCEDMNVHKCYFVKPYPVSVKEKGFKESLLGLLLQMKSSDLWQKGFKEAAYAYLEASWEVVKELTESWVVNCYIMYCNQKGSLYCAEQLWEKAVTAFSDILVLHYYCHISQYRMYNEEVNTEKDEPTDELIEAEQGYYDARLMEACCWWLQDNKEEAEEAVDALLSHLRVGFEEWNTGAALYWICDEIKNEHSQEKSFNLIRLLKCLGPKPLWNFCHILCAPIRTEMNERGIAESYDWPRELFEAVEAMFNSVIPYVENVPSADRNLIGYLHYYKGDYMLQTRRFVVAEKEYQKALDIIADIPQPEDAVTQTLLKLLIDRLCELYELQRTKGKKEFLQSLLSKLSDKQQKDYSLLQDKVNSLE